MIIHLPIGLLQSNCYLIYDKETKEGIIVDPSGDLGSLREEIATRNVDVRYIVNTHGHFDHVAGNAELKALDVPLAIHPADEDLLVRGGGASWFDVDYVASQKPSIELTDGKKLAAGNLEVQVIHTPGHTPGSVCLYVPQDRALITGDTLFAGSVGRTDLPGGDPRALTKSLERLLDLPGETTIYPGHGPMSTLEKEWRTNPWLKRIAHQKG